MILACLFLCLSLGATILGPLSNPDHWLAIVGDSGVTGAASAPDLEPTVSSLIDHLTEAPPVAALTRIFYAPQESVWLGLGAKLAQRLDVPEHSFAYTVGRALQVAAQDIVLVAQDGVRVDTIAMQFARIFALPTATLPPLVLVSFTANDLCDIRVFAHGPDEWAASYRVSLASAWDAAAPYLKPHPRGTRIAVLAPLDVINVVTNPEIMAQAVNIEGQGQVTCGKLRGGELKASGLSSWLVLRMLNLMCPSVTSTRPGDAPHLAHLRAVLAAFNNAWKAEIETLNARFQGRGLSWRYLEDVRDLKFTTGDVGHDCFHPSARGHAKIAEVVLRSLRDN